MRRKSCVDMPYSLKLDGNSDRVEAGAIASQLNAGYSLSVKAKMLQLANSNGLFRCSVSDKLWFNIQADGTLRSYHSDLTPASVTSIRKIIDFEWHTFTVTFDGTTVRQYLDGVLVTEQSVTGTLNLSGNINIGGNGDANDFTGHICEAAIFKRKLTTEEVENIHFDNVYPTDSFRRFKLNEGSGAVATDSSPNAVNGSISQSTWTTDAPSKVRISV